MAGKLKVYFSIDEGTPSVNNYFLLERGKFLKNCLDQDSQKWQNGGNRNNGDETFIDVKSLRK